MKILLAAAVIALMAGPAYAQSQAQVPRAGESTGKSEKEIRDEKEVDQAYQKSLGNIPAQKATDPWAHGARRQCNEGCGKGRSGQAGQGRRDEQLA